jgi:hypothetical protein
VKCCHLSVVTPPCYNTSPTTVRTVAEENPTHIRFQPLFLTDDDDVQKPQHYNYNIHFSLLNMLASSKFNRNHNMLHCTTQKFISDDKHPAFDSPMLTPSPLKKRPLFPRRTLASGSGDPDDIFLQSPFKSPSPHQFRNPSIINADDDSNNFPASTSTPFFPSSDSQPLRTPVKEIHRVSSRSGLGQYSSTGNPNTNVGNKRKPTTPLAHERVYHRVLTPLVTVHGAYSTNES